MDEFEETKARLRELEAQYLQKRRERLATLAVGSPADYERVVGQISTLTQQENELLEARNRAKAQWTLARDEHETARRLLANAKAEFAKMSGKPPVSVEENVLKARIQQQRIRLAQLQGEVN